MNKKIVVLMAFFTVFAGAASAKSIGLNLEIGAVYTNHQLHYFGGGTQSDGFRHHSIKFKHMGGFNVGLSYDLPKNWAIYASTIFAFNSIFANDTQFGIGYNFRLARGFSLFLGGAFAVGGSQFNRIIANKSAEWEKYTNLGGGVRLTAAYMFTGRFGIYFGGWANYYKPIKGVKLGQEMPARNLPTMVQSLNAMAGLKIAF